MTYKRFTCLIIFFSFFLFIANIFLWKMQTENIFKQERVAGHGDLARLGYFNAVPALTKQREAPLRKHIEFNNYIKNSNSEKIDVITIGDSFFNKESGYYFQDILASEYNYNVLNIRCMYGFEALEMVAVLLNSGYLDLISPKAVIVESVGRASVTRYGKTLELNSSKYHFSKNSIDAYYKMERKENMGKDYFFDPRMYEINTKYLLSKFNLFIDKNHLTNSVQYANLTKPLFSNPGNENLLIFYSDDLNNISQVNKQKVFKINDNLNTMAIALRDRKIQFMFLPAVDKYDLYSDFVENRSLNINPLFSYMRELEKNYIFIDTKSILGFELSKGEKDIYWLDDSHWSWKGQAVVAEKVNKELLF